VQATFAPYISDPSSTLSCAACCEDLQLREVCGQVCGHVMCYPCWRRMLSTHVSQGDAFIRCVGFKCRCGVEEGLIMSLLTHGEYANFRRRLQDSFIQLRGWKWCINAQCDKVVSASQEERFAVVSCTCHAQFCFSCARDGHWPVSCNAARAYLSSQLVRDMRARAEARIGSVKDADEEVRVDVKPCPKCKTPWERSGGCIHFQCQVREKQNNNNKQCTQLTRKQQDRGQTVKACCEKASGCIILCAPDCFRKKAHKHASFPPLYCFFYRPASIIFVSFA
jgi:hypothetical protein